MGNEPTMTHQQRALQLWSLLVLAARTQTVLSYPLVFQMTGLVQQGQSAPLGHIAFYCMHKGLPILPALVVGQETGKPNADFYDALETGVDAEQRRCFVHDWLAEGVRPTIADLEYAYENKDRIKQAYKEQARKATAA